MRQFKKGDSYRYSHIKEVMHTVSFFLEEFGEEIIGQHFLVWQVGDETISFMLDGTSGEGFIYECIYNE